MSTRRIGDREVFPVGLGCMPMSTKPDRDESRSLATIAAALDAGVTLFDTADAYALDEAELGHNEELLGRALAGRDDVVVATKGGHVRRGEEWELDGRPEHLKAACEASLRRLGVETIFLYQYHRPDPAVPFAESVGALRELRDEGKILHAGLSNVDAAQIEEALGIVEIAAVQNELSFRYPDPLRNGELEVCARHGIAFLPWSPLGGPRHAGELAPAPVRAAAERHGVSPQRVTIAWLLSLADEVLPIPGASRPESIVDSTAATTLELDADELEAIGASAAG
jgi:aryl-alcohol dehydrogenase-like predicted oxidoreductase